MSNNSAILVVDTNQDDRSLLDVCEGLYVGPLEESVQIGLRGVHCSTYANKNKIFAIIFNKAEKDSSLFLK